MSIEDCHILEIHNYDVSNGPGIRVSVWVSGCCHKCKGCHNPHTWKWKQGRPLTESIIERILNYCDKPYIQGLTLSGGDPMFPKNREGIFALCKAFRSRFGNSKNIWMWTGYNYEDLRLLPDIQLIDTLIDGKYIEELKDISLVYAGSSNQRIIHLRSNECPISLNPVSARKM